MPCADALMNACAKSSLSRLNELDPASSAASARSLSKVGNQFHEPREVFASVDRQAGKNIREPFNLLPLSEASHASVVPRVAFTGEVERRSLRQRAARGGLYLQNVGPRDHEE